MLLPQTLPPPDEQSLMGISKARTHDKALIDRELTRELVSALPSLVTEMKSIALSPDAKDSDKLTALINIFDRVAGKPTQTVHHSGSVGSWQIPPDEVERRLAHLRGE